MKNIVSNFPAVFTSENVITGLPYIIIGDSQVVSLLVKTDSSGSPYQLGIPISIYPPYLGMYFVSEIVILSPPLVDEA